MSTKTTLTLTDTVGSAVRKPAAPQPLTPQTQHLQQISQVWNGMSGSAKDAWNQLNQKAAAPLQTTTPPRTNAFSTFVSLNSALLTTGSPIQPTAPTAPDFIPALPAVTLTAVYTAGALTLTLHAATPYTMKVIVSGAKPVLASQNIYYNTPFRTLGSAAGLGPATDVSALYAGKYRVGGLGYKIALRLVGVSPNGFKSAPVTVTAIVTATSGLTLG